MEDPPLLPLTDQATKQKRLQAFRDHVATFHAMSEAEIMAKGKAESPHWHDDDFPAWATSKKQVDAEAYPQYAQPWQDNLARILAPTLLIHGEAEKGSLVTWQTVDEAKCVNPRLRFAKIEGAGHNIRRERFPDYLETVQQFLVDP
jgi:pimeloyl-ACP methyl ester carboxylesterase